MDFSLFLLVFWGHFLGSCEVGVELELVCAALHDVRHGVSGSWLCQAMRDLLT